MPKTSINLRLEPGQKVTLQPVDWEGFEEIIAELGNKRSSRIAYANEILEIMAPLPEHERSKVLYGFSFNLLQMADTVTR